MDDSVSLREYFTAILAEKDKALSAALASQEKAVAAAWTASALATEKAEKQASDWRANANEWRATMTDREARFVTHGTYDGMVDKLSDLAKRVERAEAKVLGVAMAWGGLVGVAAVLSAMYAIFHHTP